MRGVRCTGGAGEPLLYVCLGLPQNARAGALVLALHYPLHLPGIDGNTC